MRTRVEGMKGVQQGVQARDRVLEALLATVEIPLPEGVVKAEIDARNHSLAHQLEAAGMTKADFLAAEGQTEEEFDADIEQSTRGGDDGAVRARQGRREGAAVGQRGRSSPSTSSGPRRATAWARTSSPSRSCRPARCRCSSARSCAARRWPWCWSRPRSCDESGRAGRPRGAARGRARRRAARDHVGRRAGRRHRPRRATTTTDAVRRSRGPCRSCGGALVRPGDPRAPTANTRPAGSSVSRARVSVGISAGDSVGNDSDDSHDRDR